MLFDCKKAKKKKHIVNCCNNSQRAFSLDVSIQYVAIFIMPHLERNCKENRKNSKIFCNSTNKEA